MRAIASIIANNIHYVNANQESLVGLEGELLISTIDYLLSYMTLINFGMFNLSVNHFAAVLRLEINIGFIINIANFNALFNPISSQTFSGL